MSVVHKKCGGTVQHQRDYSKRCLGCGARWSEDQWVAMPYIRWAKEFEHRDPPGPAAPSQEPSYKLVEEQVGRVRFTKLVPR
jgi:hypothetical protein